MFKTNIKRGFENTAKVHKSFTLILMFTVQCKALILFDIDTNELILWTIWDYKYLWWKFFFSFTFIFKYNTYSQFCIKVAKHLMNSDKPKEKENEEESDKCERILLN